MSDLLLNADQARAASDFALFCASPLDEFVITGPAGTGKTTLLRHLYQHKNYLDVGAMLGANPITNWAFTATTNKAAEVLGNSIGAESSTIHSYLGLRVYDDYATGQTKISLRGDADVICNTVIVIDEASMIDRQLHKYIQSQTMNCKIVYVGDKCQLAPVGEDISPVFVEREMAELNQIVRSQHTPAITDLCNRLRDNVNACMAGNPSFFDIPEVPGVIDYLDEQQAQAEIYDHFVARNDGHARILCYTNKMAVGINDWIRQARQLPETYTISEHIISNTATPYRDGKGAMTRVEEEMIVLSVGEPYMDVLTINGERIELRAYDIYTAGGMLTVCLESDRLKALLAALKKHAKAGHMSWSHFFNVQKRYADLRPRDACTVHKSQGSTYHTVFVHLKDIGTCTMLQQTARMLYVACSRPTHRICLIGQLPAKYRGG